MVDLMHGAKDHILHFRLALSSFRLERREACSQVEIKLHPTILDGNGGINFLENSVRVRYLAINTKGGNLLGGRSLWASDSRFSVRWESEARNCRLNFLSPVSWLVHPSGSLPMRYA